ncbi:MAG: RsmB/NOP family class I SAM-dependent RNA methyltransferase [Bacilli bacterium]|nr:RsmB/NOP family class I SAM-dependent RNA methyltransferase [Bacilli bacterium]
MNIPEFLYNRLINSYGEDLTSKIIDRYNLKRIVSLRVNTLKSNIDEVKEVLDKNNISYKEVESIPFALIVDSDESKLKELDIYKNGLIYLQSISSMLPPLYLDLVKGSTILDMAASPGGKTSEICALSNNEIYVTATEVNEIRRDRLVYNLDKLGCKNVTTLRVDARNLDEYFSFDNILLDAPCSGSGTIEENDFSKINDKLVTNITKVQESLLRKALTILKPGKTMIYSTCSILKEENENIINKMMKEFNIEIVPIEVGFETLPSKIEGVQTIMPSELNEGFFICKIKKL